MDSALEPPSQRAGVLAVDAGDQDALFALKNGRRDPDNLRRRFAGAENDFRETFPQRAVGIHLGESEVRQWRGLKSAQHPVACDLSGAQFVQQLDGFRRGHRLRMPKPLAVWHLKTHWAS